MGGVREVCPVEYCDAPDVSCNMGYSYERCPYRAGSGPNVIPIANGSSVDEGGAIFVPWSGRSLGTRDVGLVASRGKPAVIGVIGPHNSGKTTLLAAFYLLIS